MNAHADNQDRPQPHAFRFDTLPESASGAGVCPQVHKGESAFVHVSLYDLAGTLVRELCEARVYDAGEHRETRSLNAVAPGYYHSVLRANDRILRRLLHIVP